MKIFPAVIYLLLVTTPLFGQVWTQRASLTGTARFGGEAFTIGNKGYIAGGVSGGTSGTYYSDIWSYDAGADTWQMEGNIPVSGRSGLVAVANDTSVFIGMGWNGGATFRDFYQYVPSTNSWDTLPSYPGQGGRNSVAGVLGNKVYIGAGGYQFNGVSHSDFWEYNIDSNLWVQKANLPVNRSAAVFFELNGVLYYGLGHDHSSDYSDLWAYNPVNDSWTRKLDFPGVGRLQAAFFTIGGKAIVGGGHRLSSGTVSLDDYYEYNPMADSWRAVSNHFTDSNRTLAIGFNVNGRAFMYGGSAAYPSSVLNDLWEYNLTTALREDSRVESELLIYPLPNNGRFMLEMPMESKTISFFKLYNSSGQLISEQELPAGKRNYNIQFSELQSGLYLYQLSTKGSVLFSGSIPVIK